MGADHTHVHTHIQTHYLDVCDKCGGVVYPCWHRLLACGQSLQFSQQVPDALQLQRGQVNFDPWLLLQLFFLTVILLIFIFILILIIIILVLNGRLL